MIRKEFDRRYALSLFVRKPREDTQYQAIAQERKITSTIEVNSIMSFINTIIKCNPNNDTSAVPLFKYNTSNQGDDKVFFNKIG